MPIGGNKEKKVYDIFQNISSDYDRLNNVISFNMHKRWKKDAIRRLKLPKNSRMLDVCCGTGDFSFLCSTLLDHKIEIVGLDFSENMLNEAKKKKGTLALNNIEFVHGNAMELPYEDNQFETVIIGFGLRNTPDYEQVIREMTRVVKHGGTVACLETSHPTFPIFKQLYWLYFKYIMPQLGKLLSKHKKEYQWLNDSSQSFLTKKELKLLFMKASLRNVGVVSYAGGSVALHMGQKSRLKEKILID